MTDLTPMIDAVRQAAILCRRIQQTHFVRSEKGVNDPVTIADYGSQAILHRALSQAFPDDAVISEEQSSLFVSLLTDDQRVEIVNLLTDALDEPVTQADVIRWLDHGSGRRTARSWVIDPIDGTKGFIGMRRYSICVAMMQDGQPVEGILGSPGFPTDDGMGMAFYTRDGAAYMEPLGGGPARQIHVSDNEAMATLRVTESVVREHANLEAMARVRAIAGMTHAHVEQVDSQDKYAMVASGEADLYMRLPRSEADRYYIWDHAAGTAIVQQAGGLVTDINGDPLDFAQGPTLARNLGILVSNGRVHQRVIDAIRQARSASATDAINTIG